MLERIGITSRIAKLISDVVRVVQTRLEMISVELQRERNVALLQLKLTLVSAVAAVIAGVSGVLWVVFSVSPDRRSIALGALTAAFIVISASVMFIARRNQKGRRRLFDRLIEQLELDRATLMLASATRDKERCDESPGRPYQAA